MAFGNRGARLSWRLVWGMALGLTGGVMLGLSAGAAGASILDCRLRRGQGINGLIAPQYLFEHAPGAVTGQVYDGLIRREMARPQIARVREEATRLVLGWQVRVKDGYGNPVDVDFRAELARDALSVTVQARIAGDLVAEGEGACGAPEG